MFVYISRFCQIFSVPVLDTPLPRPPIRRPYFCLCYSSVCLLMYIILRCKPYSQYMFLCYLLSSLSPIVSVLLQCFQLTGLRLSFFLICDPPRPRTVWLVLRSVVPYRSLFFLTPLFFVSSLSTLNWPLGPATVCRSSRGSLLLDQTYHPSPSDLSLTGYFTAQASFYLVAFFTPYTHWSFYRSQFLVVFTWSPF